MIKCKAILLSTAFAALLAYPAAPAQGPAIPPDKKDEISRLVQQLGSDDFEVREGASTKLAVCDDALPQLREATKSQDAEVRQRAKRLIDGITKRLGDKAFDELLDEVNKQGIDRFIDRMALAKDYATPEHWEIAYKLARIAALRASKLSGRQFRAPRLDLSTMQTLTECPQTVCAHAKVRLDGLDRNVTCLGDSLVVSAGSLQHFTSVDNCVIFVNGDMEGITGVTNSVIFCNGNLGRITGVQDCIILCTSEFKGSTTANGSFFQVHTMGRHTLARDNVYVNLKEVKGAAPMDGNQFIATEQGPLPLFTLFDAVRIGVELKAADGGCVVVSVRDGMPFAKAGFQKGDLVLTVDKTTERSLEAIRKYLRRRRAGDEALFKVRRGDKVLELKVQFLD